MINEKKLEEQFKKLGWKLRGDIVYSNGTFYADFTNDDGECLHIEYDLYPDEELIEDE
jgi:hypothetical protein